MSRIYVGIDTSNYTTSVCAVDAQGKMLFEARRILHVPQGERGLQQSQALYQHIVALPSLLDDLAKATGRKAIERVAVSSRPRKLQGSFMPVFQAGILAGHALAATSQAHVVETTHQAGHIAAGVATSYMPEEGTGSFAVLHLSGGTTDLLIARKDQIDFGVKDVQSGQDLHVGQMVDRIGVYLGLSFPAGKHLERLAMQVQPDVAVLPIPSSVKDGIPSFSGPLSAAIRLVQKGVEPSLVAASVFRCIANTVEKMIRHMYQQTGIDRVLLVGGVASSTLLKERLDARFTGSNIRLYFCDPAFSSDNAYGIALIAKNEWGWAKL